jgi:hypothetical protein
MTERLWFSDFKLDQGAILVKKTGARIAPTLELAHTFFSWMCYYLTAQSWRIGRFLSGYKRPTIAFFPDKPRPWYFIWPVMHVAGARVVDDPANADIVMQFDDQTSTQNVPPRVRADARLVNFQCHDVSKSRVAAVFERAAGYALTVDPTTFKGRMVEKSEANAAHDGRILEGPLTEPVPGKTYQRLIDNEIPGGLVEDLRCCLVGGTPIVVFRKRRALDRRFANENIEVKLDDPRNCYSADEISVIERFAAGLGLDWGGVDVLRDCRTGRIYIVDANKTDMGPPLALKLGQKLRATRLMARAFAETFSKRRR